MDGNEGLLQALSIYGELTLVAAIASF